MYTCKILIKSGNILTYRKINSTEASHADRHASFYITVAGGLKRP